MRFLVNASSEDIAIHARSHYPGKRMPAGHQTQYQDFL
jgi:hypothetical protein